MNLEAESRLRQTVRDQKLEAKANLLSAVAQAKQRKGSSGFMIPEDVDTTEFFSSPEAELNARDLALEAQLNKVSSNAIVYKLGWKPLKIKSDVTTEMIQEYQKEMLKPVEIGGNKYRYHPSAVNTDILEYVPPVPLDEIRTPEEINRAGAYSRQSVANIARSEALIAQLEAEGPRLAEQYGLEVADLGARGASPAVLASREAGYRRNEALRLGRIAKAGDYIRDLEARIEAIRVGVEENDAKLARNSAESTRIKAENRDKLKAVEDDFNLLNRGRARMDRGDQETDEEYQRRLIETGALTYDEDAMEASADLEFREQLRNKMKEILRNTALISNAIKLLSSEEVFETVKQWERVKKAYLDVYGPFNPNVTEDDLKVFFLDMVAPSIDSLNSKYGPAVSAAAAVPAEAVVPPKPKLPETVVKRNTFLKGDLAAWVGTNYPELSENLKKAGTKANQIAYLIREKVVLTKEEIAARARASEAARPSGPTFPSVPRAEEKKEDEDRHLEDLKQAFGDMYGREITENPLYEATISSTTLARFNARVQGLVSDGYDMSAFLDFRTKTGLGIRSAVGHGLEPIKHALPKLIDFGRVKISPTSLYYKNTLAIKHKSGNSLTGINNTRVSDQFVSIIMDLLKGKKPTLKDFSRLGIGEKQIYDQLIFMAGLSKDVDNDFGSTKEDMKKRLQLVEGEIGAGNNNPDVKKELHSLLHKMAQCNMIGFDAAKKHYKAVLGI